MGIVLYLLGLRWSSIQINISFPQTKIAMTDKNTPEQSEYAKAIQRHDIEDVYETYFLKAHDGLHDRWEKGAAYKVLNRLNKYNDDYRRAVQAGNAYLSQLKYSKEENNSLRAELSKESETVASQSSELAKLRDELETVSKRREDLNVALRFKVDELEKSRESNRELVHNLTVLLSDLFSFTAMVQPTETKGYYKTNFSKEELETSLANQKTARELLKHIRLSKSKTPEA